MIIVTPNGYLMIFSLIVDELARWKSLLIQHQDDADHYIRLLFHERNVLWNSLVDTQTVLGELRTAFDPLGISKK
jgi:hypothetical protein